MKKRVLNAFLCLIVLIVVFENADCQKQDYVWKLGKDRVPEESGIQTYHFDFNNNPFQAEKTINAFNFDSNNASICDQDGKLLFYTNGCMVANASHEIMPNGEGINDGIFFQLAWGGDCINLGYPGAQNITILPDPGNEYGYYIIHKIRHFEPEVHGPSFTRDLLYTYVDMRLDGGMGDVVEKNQVFFSGEMIQSNYLTSIEHADGLNWWILQPLRDTNLMYTFLLDKDGIHHKMTQETQETFIQGGASGVSRFSPDGSKYAYYSKLNQLLLFDFDRVTGQLSNMKKIILRVIPPTLNLFGSVEWSSNSRFVYVATQDSLHQIDLMADPIEDGIELIDVYNGTRDPFNTTFFLMTLAPDCRIYMCPTSSTNSYHVIHHPDRKGKACHFVQNGIQLPYQSSVASFPNFPRWRVDEVDKCDSTITTMLGEPVHYVRKMQVWPTPATHELYLDLPENISGEVYLLDMQGKPALRQRIDHHTGTFWLDISGLVPGGYIVEFYPSDPAHRLIWSGKVVVSGR